MDKQLYTIWDVRWAWLKGTIACFTLMMGLAGIAGGAYTIGKLTAGESLRFDATQQAQAKPQKMASARTTIRMEDLPPPPPPPGKLSALGFNLN